MSDFLVESAWYIGTIVVMFGLYKLYAIGSAVVAEKRQSGEWGFIDSLESIAKMAVYAAEQLKLKHGYDNADALEYAIGVISDYLEGRGIKIPISVIIAAIESAVWKTKQD